MLDEVDPQRLAAWESEFLSMQKRNEGMVNRVPCNKRETVVMAASFYSLQNSTRLDIVDD